MSLQFKVDKVIKSIEDLRSQINLTISSLSSHPDLPPHVLDRVGQYTGVVNKQSEVLKDLTESLADLSLSENTKTLKVVEATKRVNALSAFVRDDAQELHAFLVNSGFTFKPR